MSGAMGGLGMAVGTGGHPWVQRGRGERRPQQSLPREPLTPGPLRGHSQPAGRAGRHPGERAAGPGDGDRRVGLAGSGGRRVGTTGCGRQRLLPWAVPAPRHSLAREQPSPARGPPGAGCPRGALLPTGGCGGTASPDGAHSILSDGEGPGESLAHGGQGHGGMGCTGRGGSRGVEFCL